MRGPTAPDGSGSTRRLVAGYAALIVLLVAVAVPVLRIGSDEHATGAIAGRYSLSGAQPCLDQGDQGVVLAQSGQFVDISATNSSAQLLLDGDRLSGDAHCTDGRHVPFDATVHFGASADDRQLAGVINGSQFTAKRAGSVAVTSATCTGSARSGEETFGRLMVAIAAVILAARLLGLAIKRLRQPQVMGEVLAGILLGPSLFGAVAPSAKCYLFPGDIVPLLRGSADIGLAFFMFLVGMELDISALRGRRGQAALISNASVAVPMALGLIVALPLYTRLAPDTKFVAFALFIGVAMSITAFPVLARILVERRMLGRPVGAMALAAAAVDDVSAWSLLALATAIAGTGSGTQVVRVIGLTAVFCLAMAVVGRPLLRRVSRAYDEAGRIPAAWVATIFVGVLVSAYTAQQIGIAAIFGAFVMGLIMPRRADLTAEVNGRVEDFVVTVLLPLFFVVVGLNVEVGRLNRPELIGYTVLLVGVAVAGKWLGALGAARWTGLGWRDSAAIAALMNTRGLTELIVLTIGAELGVITQSLFSILVIMALITTFMAGPSLRLIDRRGELSSPVEEDLRREAPITPEEPQRTILVASLDDRNLDALLDLAEPLAQQYPPRALTIVRLLVESRFTTGLVGDDRELRRTTAELTARRNSLAARQIAARAAAFTSADPGDDLVRLSSQDDVDIVLIDGRRPLLGAGVPRGPVGGLLSLAPCDVAVLVARDGARITLDEERAVVVPFGGAEHDWAALELGARLAMARSAPLRLLGAAADIAEGRRDASRLLANASLVVQQLAGVVATPVLAEPGRAGVLAAAEGAGLLIIGLSDRWREEGLGEVRAAVARDAEAATLFVRRGTRPGALAPREQTTRFAWSTTFPGRAAATSGGEDSDS